MSDDPYDFEIAIPSSSATRSGGGRGGENAKSFGERRYGGVGSDSSDMSVSNSDDSDHDDDGEEEEEEDSPIKATTKHSKQHAQSATTTRSTTSLGGGGSSALDKAKSFLSKYSTKSVDTKQSKPQASSRSNRRLELSLDDSMDFSSDEDEQSDNLSRKNKKEKAASNAKIPAKPTLGTAKATSASAKRVQLSDSEDYGVDSDDEKSRTSMQQNARNIAKEESESGDDEDNVRAKNAAVSASIPIRSTTAATVASRFVESSAQEDEEDEEVASFMNESDEVDPPPFSAAIRSGAPVSSATKVEVLSSVVQTKNSNSAVKSSNLNASEEQEESIASKSDYIESFEDQDDDLSSTKPVVVALTKQEIAVSESGVYEDEDFDEESGFVPAPAKADSQPPVSQLEDSSKTVEPAFDYSMDFSDDNVVEGKHETPPPAVSVTYSLPVVETEAVRDRKSVLPSPTNSHDSDRQDQSDYLESDASNDDQSVVRNILEAPRGDEQLSLSHSHSSESIAIDNYKTSEVPETRLSELEAPSRTDLDRKDTFALDTIQDHKSQDSLAPSAVQHEAPPKVVIRSTPSNQEAKTETAIRSIGSSHTVAPIPVTPRERILIVRDYEDPARNNVEMKDASTQFTGNHAAIQTDLTPDGMHSLHLSPRSPASKDPMPLPPSQDRVSREHERMNACESSPTTAVPPPPPPPPPASILGSPGYSMDLLHLPSAASTSIYKQQLLALQEQILLKKRETERLVHERMTFQYSSLRGTERFLSSNRPGKLELWQALMRVDPALTERKAREIARLVAENAAV